MKRGGILSRLAQLEEESPYKPETTLLCVRSRSILKFAPAIAPKELELKSLQLMPRAGGGPHLVVLQRVRVHEHLQPGLVTKGVCHVWR